VRYSRAILKGLRSNSNYSAASGSSRQHVLPHLRSALKTFAEAAEADTSGRTQAKARKMLRRLRPEIARKLQGQVINDDRAAESRRVPIDLLGTRQMDPSEKINRWGVTAPFGLPKTSARLNQRQSLNQVLVSLKGQRAPWTQGIWKLQPMIPLVCTGRPSTPAEVLKHITTQPAFKSLIHTTEKLFERYHSQKIDLIRH
jgi:ribosomal protein S20